MRFRLIFAAEGEDGLAPIKNDKVKSGEIPTFKACSNWRRQASPRSFILFTSAAISPRETAFAGLKVPSEYPCIIPAEVRADISSNDHNEGLTSL